MTNAAPLQSVAGVGVAQRPLSLPRRLIPFDMAAVAASSSAATIPPPYGYRRSSSRSLPNWTLLTGDAGGAEEEASTGGGANVPPLHRIGDDAAVVAPSESDENLSSVDGRPPEPEQAYSAPREASAAYRSGLLKSDFNISSNHPSIRLAFRYLSEEAGDGNADEDARRGGEEESGELYLCWVRQDGIPCHFRPMRPVLAAANNVTDNVTSTEDGAESDAVGGEGHGNLRGTMSNGTTPEAAAPHDTLLVNENDHIETTFPGHAFVFCCRVNQGQISARNDGDDDASRNEDDPTVVNEDGKTYFLRKRRRDREEDAQDEGEDDREAFLVVGGFRPGPVPGSHEDEGDDDRSEAENNGERGAEDEEESNGEGKTDDDSDRDSDDDSDDDSFDGRELRVQLVTILRKNPPTNGESSARATGAHASNAIAETDVELPSEAFGCSDCAQAVPCLRGAMNPRTSHTPAFVATKSSGDIELPYPPSSNGDQTAEDPTDEGPALEVTVCVTRLDPTPLDTSSKRYDEVTLGGWPCRCEPGCFPPDMDVPEIPGRNLLRSRFESDLLAASSSLPPAARERLVRSTPVWINKSQSFGPKAAPVRARDGCFHPGAGWLRRNGMNPAKCGGVEWYDAQHYLDDCDLWGPGGLMLHELSHAWHCLHVADGYDNADVRDAYERAMEEGLYDCVPVRGPQGPRCKAYACQDPMEYFAELSVAFLGGLDEGAEHNKWFPFNRSQLREHDPRAFTMLCRIWGVEDDGSREDRSPGQGDGGGGEDSRES